MLLLLMMIVTIIFITIIIITVFVVVVSLRLNDNEFVYISVRRFVCFCKYKIVA